MTDYTASDHKTIEALDGALPQTQCTLCSYSGCKPYARAIVKENAPLDRCLPGGVRVMRDLAQLLDQKVDHLEADLKQRTRYPAKITIDEETCIGCTKCIAACPVDAIIGAGKKMHRVITDSCTGCELCIAPCPVDCIDLIPAKQQNPTISQQKQAAREARDNFNRREHRLRIQKNKSKSGANNKTTTSITPHPEQQGHDNRATSIGLINRFTPINDGLNQKTRQDIIARALAKSRARRNNAPQKSQPNT